MFLWGLSSPSHSQFPPVDRSDSECFCRGPLRSEGETSCKPCKIFFASKLKKKKIPVGRRKSLGTTWKWESRSTSDKHKGPHFTIPLTVAATTVRKVHWRDAILKTHWSRDTAGRELSRTERDVSVPTSYYRRDWTNIYMYILLTERVTR